jgi:hypothetical protein
MKCSSRAAQAMASAALDLAAGFCAAIRAILFVIKGVRAQHEGRGSTNEYSSDQLERPRQSDVTCPSRTLTAATPLRILRFLLENR